ncbi:MAG: DNA double-strand break repair nuclease NurA [Patescibacteria group bacterium]|nr:DNA double-strand break repair nuclease NurA [Bacteroidales bacterium]MDD3777868.1 DNA double-strand break repair nuclease NurA [Patescibacteria group bacterium]
MSYTSKNGRRPNEYASKSSHGYIINDPEVSEFLTKCSLPKRAEEIQIPDKLKFDFLSLTANPIKHIIAVDGGRTEVSVKNDYPSSTITFFQFGALIFKIEDLEELSKKAFIDPEDIAKLNKIERYKLALPTKNILLTNSTSLTDSFRKSLYNFFTKKSGGDIFTETLKWLIFQEFDKPLEEYVLSSCPNCGEKKVKLNVKKINNYVFNCDACKKEIYITDVFRLHEAVDDEMGAGGVVGYLTVLIEQIIIVHLIKTIIETKPSLLSETLFIKDGPLAFFGQTANMHKPLRVLTNFLADKHNIFLAGLEKSGPFVEHADMISSKMKPGTVLLLDNEYIYKYILPGKADVNAPYASSSYYGAKIIFKSFDKKIYVITIPVENAEVVLSPKKNDFNNIDLILHNIQKLKCDMYDNALFPVALANKLVSLSNHPSTSILEKFAKNSIHK